MVPYKLLTCFVVFGLTIGTTPMVCAETAATDQDKVHTFYVTEDWQNQQKVGPQEQYQFFAPPKKSTEEKYLILDPDGHTISDYRGLIDAPPQTDKKPSP
jgi:hypothetical protein